MIESCSLTRDVQASRVVEEQEKGGLRCHWKNQALGHWGVVALLADAVWLGVRGETSVNIEQAHKVVLPSLQGDSEKNGKVRDYYTCT